MEPTKGAPSELQLREDQVCSLIGNAYGRVDAPLLFYRELALQLKKLGFCVHPLEPCIHYLESWKNDVRTIHGVLGTHVDDGICGGDEVFHKQLQKLREVLPFWCVQTEEIHIHRHTVGTITRLQYHRFTTRLHLCYSSVGNW